MLAGSAGVIHTRATGEHYDLVRELVSLFPEDATNHWVALSGTPGPTYKVILLPVGADGNPVGAIKTAWTPVSVRRIRVEACMLRKRLPLMPRFLGLVECKGAAGIAMEYVDGEQPSRDFVNTARGRHCLEELASTESGLLLEHPLLERLQTIAGERLARLVARCPDLRVRSAVAQGDFAPWNVRVSGTSPRVLDWEYADSEAIEFLDESHWHLRVAQLLDRCNSKKAVWLAVDAMSSGDLGREEAICLTGILAAFKMEACAIDGRSEDDRERAFWRSAFDEACRLQENR